jgi:hypothetical protein
MLNAAKKIIRFPTFVTDCLQILDGAIAYLPEAD